MLHGQVVAYDYGIKHNILRRLASMGCRVTVVPADYPAKKVLEMNPDGVFLSNGPVRPLASSRCAACVRAVLHVPVRPLASSRCAACVRAVLHVTCLIYRELLSCAL